MTGFEFSCPDCGERIAVDRAMREEIVVGGCPVCAAAVDGTRFD